jgi:hypothetical protein
LQVTRDATLKAEVNRPQRLVTRRLNEWRKDEGRATLECLDPENRSLWKMTKWVMRVPTPSPLLVTPVGIELSDSEKTEALVDNINSHFHSVTEPSVPAVFETFDVGLLISEPNETNPNEVQEDIRGLNFRNFRALTVSGTWK